MVLDINTLRLVKFFNVVALKLSCNGQKIALMDQHHSQKSIPIERSLVLLNNKVPEIKSIFAEYASNRNKYTLAYFS